MVQWSLRPEHNSTGWISRRSKRHRRRLPERARSEVWSVGDRDFSSRRATATTKLFHRLLQQRR